MRHIAMAVVVSSLALAACGSSGKPAASTLDPGLALARCMRAHGVSNFPDPGQRGQIIAPGPGLAPDSPAFQSAQTSCQKFLPGKGRPPTMSASERAAALRFAECMRANGVPSFPDPTENAPAPGPGTRVLILRGMVFSIGTQINPGSPAFRRAGSRCGVPPPPGAP